MISASYQPREPPRSSAVPMGRSGGDPAPAKRAVHRPHRHALVVRYLHRVDPARGVGPDRLEEATLPSGVEEVEHVAAPGAGGARDLACVGERVHERQVLTEWMDDLEREPDA